MGCQNFSGLLWQQRAYLVVVEQVSRERVEDGLRHGDCGYGVVFGRALITSVRSCFEKLPSRDGLVLGKSRSVSSNLPKLCKCNNGIRVLVSDTPAWLTLPVHFDSSLDQGTLVVFAYGCLE